MSHYDVDETKCRTEQPEQQLLKRVVKQAEGVLEFGNATNAVRLHSFHGAVGRLREKEAQKEDTADRICSPGE